MLAKLLYDISFTNTEANLLNLRAFNGCFVVIALAFRFVNIEAASRSDLLI